MGASAPRRQAFSTALRLFRAEHKTIAVWQALGGDFFHLPRATFERIGNQPGIQAVDEAQPGGSLQIHPAFCIQHAFRAE